MIKINNQTTYNVFLVSLTIYLLIVLTWYFKPPWLIDHLIYLHVATPNNLEDLNFWNLHRFSLPEGHYNERWAVLVPIMLFNKIFFFFKPATTSLILIVLIHLLIFYLCFLFLKIKENNLVTILFCIFFVLAVHHTKNRTTEILADSFAIFYICLINYFVFCSKKFKKNFNFNIGLLILLPALCKIHYGIFSLFFGIIFREELKKDLKKFLLGIIASLVFLLLLIFICTDFEITKQIILNSIKVTLGYFDGGLKVSKGPLGEGWFNEWLKILIDEMTLAPIYLITSFIVVKNSFIKKNYFPFFTFLFLITILFLSYFSNFPSNLSYARPLYFFSIISLSLYLGNLSCNLKKKENLIYLSLIIIISVLSIIFLRFRFNITILDFLSLNEVSVILLTAILFILSEIDNSRLKIFLFSIILFFNIYYNNSQLLKQHYSWRNGYNNHYEYLNNANQLIKSDGEYIVHFSEWPLNKNLFRRERMYVEPGLRSLNRFKINIVAKIGNDKIFENNQIYDYLILDYKINLENYKLLKETNFYSNYHKKKIGLYLYNYDE